MQDISYENTFLNMQKINNQKQREYSVAMCYVPWQKFDPIYEDLEQGFMTGTIFLELNKPFQGRRCLS